MSELQAIADASAAIVTRGAVLQTLIDKMRVALASCKALHVAWQQGAIQIDHAPWKVRGLIFAPWLSGEQSVDITAGGGLFQGLHPYPFLPGLITGTPPIGSGSGSPPPGGGG